MNGLDLLREVKCRNLPTKPSTKSTSCIRCQNSSADKTTQGAYSFTARPLCILMCSVMDLSL